MRVLVVDDNSDNLYFLDALLRDEGFDVETAGNGAEALVAARRTPPVLVVTDLLMPVMDGYTFLRQWTADAELRRIPVVVYTATYTDPEDERLAIDCGAADFLVKPAEPDELLARLRRTLERFEPPALAESSPVQEEARHLRQYSERLVRKLEKKSLDLEEAKHALEEEAAEQRRLEERLRQAQKLEAIGTLASGIAHDFNNIVAAILGNVELARAEVGRDHPAWESLEEARKACRRGADLVERILAFGRPQGRPRQALSLRAVVEESVRFLRTVIPAGTEVALAMAEDAPWVVADPTEIHQIVLNLGTNAWHALGDGPGRIEIGVGAAVLDAGAAALLGAPGHGPFAVLSVRDDGHGMERETLARVFDPFFTTKAAGRGTGLGLSVVHGIVNSLGGAIAVSSEPGRGTLFELYFPAVEASAAPSTDEGGPLRRGDGLRILYLDDEEPLVFLAGRVLGRLGYEVAGFSDPQAALAAFRAAPQSFDLVVTDLNMPGISGLALARQMLEIDPEAAVVLASGHVTEDLEQRARAAGIRHVLYKPSTLDELSEQIHRLAARRRSPAA